jgi:7-cyano-7-deazaguanine synthase
MKKVLLYSGGMDSYILSQIEDFDTILHFKLYTKDNLKEFEMLKKSDIKDKIVFIDFPLNQWELENKIIPYRNNMLILMAAQYGNHIYIGTTAGDTTKDKDYIFKSQMEGILNYFALDTHKVKIKDYPYIVQMPLKNLTKTQIVSLYINKGKDINNLRNNSRSCYNEGDKECGKCRSCLRKYVALELNNINTDNWFKNNPLDYLKDFLEECKQKNRIEETEEVLKLILIKGVS